MVKILSWVVTMFVGPQFNNQQHNTIRNHEAWYPSFYFKTGHDPSNSRLSINSLNIQNPYISKDIKAVRSSAHNLAETRMGMN